MTRFGKDLIQSLGEAVSHAQGKRRAIVHEALDPSTVRKNAKLAKLKRQRLRG